MKRSRSIAFGALLALFAGGAVVTFSGPQAAYASDPNLQSDFGAIGDGIADDTSAIQDALDSGERVIVPSGTYRVTASVEFTEDSSWLDGTSGAVFELVGDIEIWGDGVRNVALTDLTINRTTSPHTAVKPVIRLWRSDSATFDNLTITNANTTAPVILVAGRWEDTSEDNTCFDIRITNNTIQDYQRIESGGLGGGSGEGVKGTGIGVVHCKSVEVSGNTVDENQRFFTPGSTFVNFQGAGIAVISTLYSNVSDNTVDYAGQGIDIGGGYNAPDRDSNDLAQNVSTGFRGTKFTSVHNNTISNIYGAGIKLVNGASYNSITENSVTNAGLVSIWLVPGATAPKDGTVIEYNIVSHNSIVGSGAGPGKDGWNVARAGTAIALEFGVLDSNYPLSDNRPRFNTIASNTIASTTGEMPFGIHDFGISSDSDPQYAYNNYIFSNAVNGATTQAVVLTEPRNGGFNN